MSLLLGGWGLMHGIKIPQQEYVLKMQGGAYARGGVYLRDEQHQEKPQVTQNKFILNVPQIARPAVAISPIQPLSTCKCMKTAVPGISSYNTIAL